MLTKEFSIRLDMKRALPFPPFEVVEGDTGNVLHVTLENDGEAMELSGCDVCVVFASSAGFAIQDLTSGVTLGEEAGTFSLALYPASYGAGDVRADVQVYSGPSHETLITSKRFTFRCITGLLQPETIRASTAYPPLTAATQRASEATADAQSAADAAQSAALAANAAAARVETAVAAASGAAETANARAADAQSAAACASEAASGASGAADAAGQAARDAAVAAQDAGAAAVAALEAANSAAHASRHASGGADPVTPASIGASPSGHTHTPAGVGAATASDYTAQLTANWTPTDHATAGTTNAGGSASVDADAFAGAVDRAEGTYVFTYDAANVCWKRDGTEAALAGYGVAFTGTPADADTVTVSYTRTAPYTQNASVPGMLPTDSPIADVSLSADVETALAQQAAWSLVSRITTAADAVTAVCLEAAPEAALTVRLKAVRQHG